MFFIQKENIMSSFIFPNESDNTQKIDIDDLYEANHKKNLKQLSIFNKLLNRIHKKIKITSRTKTSDKHIWFTVPEYIFGEPLYNQGECIGYLVMKLEENGFLVKYLHPNTLFVSWDNWIPQYVRDEIKRQTGKIIDERGNEIEQEEEPEPEPQRKADNKTTSRSQNGKTYTSTSDYKPQGGLVYDQEMFENLERSVKFKL